MEELISKISSNTFMMGLIGVYVGAVVTFLMRNVPIMVIEFIKREFTTTLVLYEHGNKWDDGLTQFNNFQFWLRLNKKVIFSRSLGILGQFGKFTLTNGNGNHYFWYNKRLVLFKQQEIESSGSERVKKKIIVVTLGRSHETINKMFDEFKNLHQEVIEKDKRTFILDGNFWLDLCQTPVRSFEDCYINSKTREEILEAVNHFVHNRKVYHRFGIPYRLTLMLEGPTGTGKTNIIKGLARYLDKNLYVLPPEALLKSNIVELFSRARNGILVIEDIDSLSSIKSRTKKVKEEPIGEIIDDPNEKKLERLETAETQEQKLDFNIDEWLLGGGLTNVLNSLDGLIEFEDLIIIMSTNHIEKIDSAVLRPGRVDKIIHVGHLDTESIISILSRYYDMDETKAMAIKQGTISTAELSNIIQTNFDNFDKLVRILNERIICRK